MVELAFIKCIIYGKLADPYINTFSQVLFLQNYAFLPFDGVGLAGNKLLMLGANI